jgi:hypothetical protein
MRAIKSRKAFLDQTLADPNQRSELNLIALKKNKFSMRKRNVDISLVERSLDELWY